MSNMFARISIRWKIVAAFAAVLCCTAGLGLFAVERLAAVNAAAADVRDNWLESMRTLDVVATAAELARSQDVLSHFAATEQDRQGYTKRAAAARDDLKHGWAEYEPTVTPGEEQGLAKAIQDARQAVQAGLDKYAELERTGEHDKAGQLLVTGDLATATRALRAAIAADITFNARGGKEAANAGEALGRSAMIWIFVVLGATAIVCAG
jgi:methyl-accepting chemotaxis protein